MINSITSKIRNSNSQFTSDSFKTIISPSFQIKFCIWNQRKQHQPYQTPRYQGPRFFIPQSQSPTGDILKNINLISKLQYRNPPATRSVRNHRSPLRFQVKFPTPGTNEEHSANRVKRPDTEDRSVRWQCNFYRETTLAAARNNLVCGRTKREKAFIIDVSPGSCTAIDCRTKFRGADVGVWVKRFERPTSPSFQPLRAPPPPATVDLRLLLSEEYRSSRKNAGQPTWDGNTRQHFLPRKSCWYDTKVASGFY